MAASPSNPSGGPRKRRGVSSLAAFVVVAAAVFAVLGIALVEREVAYETGVTIRVVSTPATEPITKLSPREVRAALFGLFDATQQDELARYSPAGAADAGTDVPEDGEIESSIAATRDRNVCLVAIRSGDSQRLVERLNDAARRFVELRNAAAAARVERELATLRDRTATRRDAREAAVRRLSELERQANATSPKSVNAPFNASEAPPASESLTEPHRTGRTLNPQWVLLRDEVSLLEGKLAELRGRFTEQHPEVQHALVALAERTNRFSATRQFADGGDAPNDAPPSVAAPENSPLSPPQSASVVETIPGQADVNAARANLAADSAALDEAWAEEKAAAQRQVELAANGPWRFDPAESVRIVAGGANQAPWLAILGMSLAAGLAASVLARGLAPIIDSPEDAVAALGVKVVGIVRTDDPLPPLPADPVVSARWLVRGCVAVIATAASIAVLAASGNGVGLDDVSRDPTVLLSLCAIG